MAWISGIIVALAGAGLIALSKTARRNVRSNAEGWRVFRPGWLTNGTIIGSAGISCFFSLWLLGYAHYFWHGYVMPE